jgi:hypothetical protein
MDPEYIGAATEQIEEKLRVLRHLTYEEVAELPETDGAEVTIADQRASLTVFRYSADASDGKILVVVQAAKPTVIGVATRHIERGLFFSPDGSVRDATELELRDAG